MGDYEVVTIRNASDVATILNPVTEEDSPIGKSISFSAAGIAMEGLSCDSWQVTELTDTVANLNDPMLADISIGPLDSDISSGDQQIMKSFSYSCEGEHFLNVLQVDDRVLVIPWQNSSQYLIAEIPLTQSQTIKLQKELKSMKFFSGEITGEIDESTRLGLQSWLDYRNRASDSYRFFRPAITENLMDALRVLE